MTLNSENVNRLFKYCLFTDEEAVDGLPKEHIIAEGITLKVALNPERIEKSKDEITSLINQLHPMFDGGWSFLNMCLISDTEEWTSLHKDMQELLLLGLSIGKLEYCTEDREFWAILPGGMPYIMRL